MRRSCWIDFLRGSFSSLTKSCWIECREEAATCCQSGSAGGFCQLLLQSRMTLPLPPPLSLSQSQCQCQITFTRPARPVPHTLAGFCMRQAEELWVFRWGIKGRRLIYDLHFSGLHFISEIDTFSINAGVSICIRDYDTIYQHNDISLIE